MVWCKTHVLTQKVEGPTMVSYNDQQSTYIAYQAQYNTWSTSVCIMKLFTVANHTTRGQEPSNLLCLSRAIKLKKVRPAAVAYSLEHLDFSRLWPELSCLILSTLPLIVVDLVRAVLFRFCKTWASTLILFVSVITFCIVIYCDRLSQLYPPYSNIC